MENKQRKLKAIYIGVNGQAVKIWDKEKGIINVELYDRYKRMASVNG